MEKQILCRVVTRCPKHAILKIFGAWGRLSEENLANINLKKSKLHIFQAIYEGCKEDDLSMESVGNLDLINSQIHSTSRKWTGLELKNPAEEHYISGPKSFKNMLLLKLKMVFDKVYVESNYYNGALWSRIHILGRKADSQLYKPNDVIYLVHYPRTSCAIISQVKANIQDVFNEALISVFKCDNIHVMGLTGKHVSSLADIALGKYSQLDISGGDNLVGPCASKKRKASPGVGENFHNQMCNENMAAKKMRVESTQRMFGGGDVPTLEKLEYKMEVRYRGSTHVQAMRNSSKLFRCRVKFEGPSVLEGVRGLGVSGLSAVPLPSHLSKIKSLAKNYIVIRDKSANANAST